MQNTDKKPFISVILFAYNRKRYLLEAFNSIINQTLDSNRFEIIVTKNFRDKKIDHKIKINGGKLVYHDGTYSEQLLDALHYARGEVICILEDDDLFSPNKLKFVYYIFNKYKNIIYLHNYNYVINDEGKPLNIHLNIFEKNKTTILSDKEKQSVFKLLKITRENSPASYPSCISIKKEILENYARELIQVKSPDVFIYYLSLFSNGDLYLSNRKLTYYRVHESDSNSATFERFSNLKIKFFEDSKKSVNVLLNLKNRSPKYLSIKRYILIKLREQEIEYYFYKGNYRIKALFLYLRDLAIAFLISPKSAFLRGLQIIIYIISPNKLRNLYFMRATKRLQIIKTTNQNISTSKKKT
ncbi:MAG: glycosyltransferase [Caldisphaera sp.]